MAGKHLARTMERKQRNSHNEVTALLWKCQGIWFVFHIHLSPRNRQASHSEGSRKYSLSLHAIETGDKRRGDGPLGRLYLFYHCLFCSHFFFSFFSIQGPVSSSKHTRRLHGCGNNCILMDTAVLRAPIRKQSLEFDLDIAHLEYYRWELKVLSSISATLLVNITVTAWALATLSKVLFNPGISAQRITTSWRCLWWVMQHLALTTH